MSNPFDQFDKNTNPFDQFDSRDGASAMHNMELKRYRPRTTEFNTLEDPIGRIKEGNINASSGNYVTPEGYNMMALKSENGYYIIPTIDDKGNKLDEQQAITRFNLSDQHFGEFKTLVDAEKYVGILPEYKEDTHGGTFYESLDPPDIPEVSKKIIKGARPYLEGGGAMAGALLTSETGPGAILGPGLGYSIGKQTANALEEFSGIKEPETFPRRLLEAGKDVAVGSLYEAGGQAASKAIELGAKAAGKVIKPVLGRMSGVGTGAVEEALKPSSAFDNALRGKITGEQIVDNTRSALNSLKDQRLSAYRSALANISKKGTQIDLKPIRDNLQKMMNRYNVKISPAGQIDTSRIAMGKTGRKDIEEIIETINSWGSKQGDNTAEGLDVLKRQLDDFYSDSSQARHFVTSLRNKVKDTISKAVPEYEKMTSGYQEATKLIKDIESGLMLRKQGISGRIVADQTLRRLMSSMKDNFKLRKELVDVLGNKSGKNLSAQIAGFTMRSPVPLGLAGTGPAIIAEGAYAMVNPKFWPVLAASSPRVQGEFLRLYGRMAAKINKDPRLYKEMFKQTAIYFRRENKEQ